MTQEVFALTVFFVALFMWCRFAITPRENAMGALLCVAVTSWTMGLALASLVSQSASDQLFGALSAGAFITAILLIATGGE